MNLEVTSRTSPSPDEMAAVVIVIEQLTSRRRDLDVVVDATPAWRFAGRHNEVPRFRD
ncbi:MAG TPA: hypothetical protein VIJ86_12245 [Acidimicrobiales bacterium]